MRVKRVTCTITGLGTKGRVASRNRVRTRAVQFSGMQFHADGDFGQEYEKRRLSQIGAR